MTDNLPIPIDGKDAYNAYQLRLSGLTWDEVASETPYKDSASVQVAVNKYLHKASIAQSDAWREEVLNLELDRLDALQSVAWSQAMRGDLKAIETVLKVMGHRAKLLALDTASDDRGGKRTLIVMGTTEERIQTLKEIVGDE